MNRILLLMILSAFMLTSFSQTKAAKNKKTDKKEIKETTKKDIKKEEAIIEYLNAETFKKKISNYGPGNNDFTYLGKKPCIIDFYANWCRPCRMLSPELEKVAEKYNGKIVVYKIDTEKEKELAQLFNISSIPVLLFVPTNNKQPQMLRGYRDATQLEKEIEEILLKK